MIRRIIRFLIRSLRNEQGNTIGQAILGVVGLGVGFLLGAPFIGLAIGLSLGGVLFPASVETGKMEPQKLQLQTSQYGIPVPVVYGSRKISGNLIWQGNFQADEETEEVGKGGGQEVTTGYSYSISLAFGLCMKNPTGTFDIIRAWAGKDEIDISKLTVYDGTQTSPNAHIQQILTQQGYSRFPVWKNLCYVVLENYNLGNSPYIPNFTFETGTFRDFERFDVLTLASGENCVTASAIDSSGTYAYFGLDTDPTKIVKVKLSDFTKDAVLTLPTGENGLRNSIGIDLNNEYLYVGRHDAAIGGGIAQIRLSDFTKVGARSWSIERGTVVGQANLVISSSHLYFGTSTYPDKILRITIPALGFTTLTDSLLTGEIETDLKAGVIDNVNGYAYWGTSNRSPAKIWRLNLATFAADSLILNTGENNIRSGVIDTTNGFAYFGTNQTPAKIIKIRLSDFTRVGSITLNAGENGLSTAAIDIVNGYAYFSTFTSPGKVIAIKLSDFTRLEAITLDAGENYILASTVDITNGILYVGCNTVPGKIVKVRLIGFTNDVTPPTISNDILTNDLYGLGLDSAYLDSAIFTATGAYCTTNDLLVSMIFDRQISVLDALQYIIQHHNGYITYMDGKIAHNQLKAETPISTLIDSDIVKEENKPPIQMTKAGGRDYNNKIIVEYTKRDAEYVVGTAPADDMVDIDTHGLKDATIKLDGLMTFTRTSRMAWLLLKKSLLQPENLAFKVGPKTKASNIKPGSVFALTDNNLELSQLPIRIAAVREVTERVIEIDAIEENNSIYDYMTSGENPILPPPPPNLHNPASSVIRPMAIELPAVYASTPEILVVYSKPSGESWCGASVYKSYNYSGGYVRKKSDTGSGVTGKVIGIGFLNNVAYINVELDWDATLSSATSLDNLLQTPGKNLFIVNGIFCRFQNADLLAAKQWRLSGLLYDIVGFPQFNTYGSVVVDNEVAFYQGRVYEISLEESDKFRTLYFKTPSFNFYGEEQSLADVSYISKYVDALCDKPIIPSNSKVNDIAVDSVNQITIEAGDITFGWRTSNRFGEGLNNYSDPNKVYDDFDFLNFAIEIYNGTTLLRSFTQTDKSFIYTTAMQTTDGGPFSAYTFKVKEQTTKMYSDFKVITVNTV